MQEDIYVGELKNMGLVGEVCYVGSSGDKTGLIRIYVFLH